MGSNSWSDDAASKAACGGAGKILNNSESDD